MTQLLETKRAKALAACGMTDKMQTIGEVSNFMGNNLVLNLKERLSKQITFSETNATAAAQDFTATLNGGSISTTDKVDYLTLITAGSTGTATTSIASNGAFFRRADLPKIEFKVQAPQIAAAAFQVGLYKDSDEFIVIAFDPSDDANLHLKVQDGSTTGDLDLDIALEADTDYQFALAVDTDGTIHLWVNGVYTDISGDIDEVMTSGDYKFYAAVTEAAAAAKKVRIKYIEWHRNK